MKIDPANLDWRHAQELFVGLIVPRPIAFVSTIGKDGIFDVAPFSFFAPIIQKPMTLGFSIMQKRDGQNKRTLTNIESAKDFVVNVVNEPLAEAMNRSSASCPNNIDKFKFAGLTPVKADIVKPPLVAESPINMECRLLQILQFGTDRQASFVIGEVVRVHVKDELYADGRIQMSKLKAIARMSAELYCRTNDIFEIKMPEDFH